MPGLFLLLGGWTGPFVARVGAWGEWGYNDTEKPFGGQGGEVEPSDENV